MDDDDTLDSLDYDREVIERVWLLAQAIPGNDAALWRKDEQGAWINRQEYRNRRSQFGWEIADYGYFLRRVGVESLRPLQWQNHMDIQIAARTRTVVTADGLNNVRRLL
jgi:hypothetical protein